MVISGQDRLVDICGVTSFRATSSPLYNDKEIRVSMINDIDDLADAVDRAWVECDMLDTSGLQTIDDLDHLLCSWNTSSNTESINGEALLPYLLPKWKSEGELAGINAQSSR